MIWGLKLNSQLYRIFVIFRHAEQEKKKAKLTYLPNQDRVHLKKILCPSCIVNIFVTKYILEKNYVHFPKTNRGPISEK